MDSSPEDPLFRLFLGAARLPETRQLGDIPSQSSFLVSQIRISIGLGSSTWCLRPTREERSSRKSYRFQKLLSIFHEVSEECERSPVSINRENWTLSQAATRLTLLFARNNGLDAHADLAGATAEESSNELGHDSQDEFGPPLNERLNEQM